MILGSLLKDFLRNIAIENLTILGVLLVDLVERRVDLVFVEK